MVCARPAQHVHRRRNNGRAEYHRHSRARVAETAKDASRHPTPDVPEHIDHGRRCTRDDHRTCCRRSRGSASLPRHALRRTRRNVPLHQGFFAEMLSIRSRNGSNPRSLCLTNVYFGKQYAEALPGSSMHRPAAEANGQYRKDEDTSGDLLPVEVPTDQ